MRTCRGRPELSSTNVAVITGSSIVPRVIKRIWSTAPSVLKRYCEDPGRPFRRDLDGRVPVKQFVLVDPRRQEWVIAPIAKQRGLRGPRHKVGNNGRSYDRIFKVSDLLKGSFEEQRPPPHEVEERRI